MANLIELLQSCGIGFIKGHYRSYFGLDDLLLNGGPKGGEKMFATFSVGNEPAGEYLLSVEKIVNDEILCIVCDPNTGQYLKPIEDEGFDDTIHVTLFPVNDKGSCDVGKFIAEGTWGLPQEYTGS